MRRRKEKACECSECVVLRCAIKRLSSGFQEFDGAFERCVAFALEVAARRRNFDVGRNAFSF